MHALDQSVNHQLKLFAWLSTSFNANKVECIIVEWWPVSVDEKFLLQFWNHKVTNDELNRFPQNVPLLSGFMILEKLYFRYIQKSIFFRIPKKYWVIWADVPLCTFVLRSTFYKNKTILLLLFRMLPFQTAAYTLCNMSRIPNRLDEKIQDRRNQSNSIEQVREVELMQDLMRKFDCVCVCVVNGSYSR